MRLRVIVNHGLLSCSNHHRFPMSQNVRKRDSAVRAALGLFQKADCDRLSDRVARGGLAGVRVAGERCEGGNTSAATFRNRLEDGLQDSLFGSTEHAEVKDGRQVDRLLNHRGISADVAFGSALRTGYEGMPATVGAGVVSLQLMKGLTMRRTIA